MITKTTIITVNIAGSDNYFSTTKNINISSSLTEVAVPYQSGTLTYNGSSKIPSWSNYNSSQLIFSGTTSGINAGTYTAKFTPKSGYIWSDGTTSTKNVSWKINQANGSVTTSADSITLNSSNNSYTLTLTGATGTATVTSSDTNLVTVTKSNATTFIISSPNKQNGSCIITVDIAASSDGNYKAYSKEITVEGKFELTLSDPISTSELPNGCKQMKYTTFLVHDNKIYTVGGATSSTRTSIYVYDESSKEFIKQTTTGSYLGVNTSMGPHGAISYNNKIHIFNYTTHYTIDTNNNNKVEVRKDLPFSKDYDNFNCCIYKNSIYMACNSNNKTSLYKYDDINDQVICVSEEIRPTDLTRYSFIENNMIEYNEELYFINPIGTNGRQLYKFNENTNKLEFVCVTPETAIMQGCFILDNSLFIVGGYYDEKNKVRKYNPETQSWSLFKTLPYNDEQYAALVCNNKVHIFGYTSDLRHYVLS